MVLSHKRLFRDPNTWQWFDAQPRICDPLLTLALHTSVCEVIPGMYLVTSTVSNCFEKVNLEQRVFFLYCSAE